MRVGTIVVMRVDVIGVLAACEFDFRVCCARMSTKDYF